MNDITNILVVDELLRLALKEDISSEDITTNAVVKDDKTKASVDLICKEDGIIAGLSVFMRVFKLLDNDIKIDFAVKDGDAIHSGDVIATLNGNVCALLSGERVALNYLQRMSGIASYTNSIVQMFLQHPDCKTKLLDTRKTTPNMRIFEKYAVKVGGGYNHRYNLSDGILLKDNHISFAGSIKNAVSAAKEYAPFVRKIEVEVETLEMVREAVEAGADIIMLDNMSIEMMKEAIAIIDNRAKTECSGNVTKENISNLISIGVDYISSGAITYLAPALDLSLKNLKVI
ncbi:carboxylating nicotinate-nucleotide diphosphorylase [Tannockella kyphosi]|uniref:carboxylating nicotinate-nucleotide diphosphorylase n=1 Tax=Tannockella kyphosi TaxID=2899121 RepID=UPI002011E05D|nr:carboxylating nicotinate-nucleotide diphosphorylase [Tannockella kyphosi]